MAFFTTVKAEIPFIPSCFESYEAYDDSDSESESDKEEIVGRLEQAAAAAAAGHNGQSSKNSTLKHGEVLPTSLMEDFDEQVTGSSSKTIVQVTSSPVTVTVNGQVQTFSEINEEASAETDNYSSGCSTPTPANQKPSKQQIPQERFDYEIDPDIGVIV